MASHRRGNAHFRLLALAASIAACANHTHAATEAEAVLSTVNVDENIETTSTEHTGSYTSRKVAIGKTPLSIKETPNSVTVITRQRLDDQNITSVPDALKYTTGVSVQRFDGAGFFNNYYVRGYQVDAIQLDGLPIGNTGNVTEVDTGVYDRIEVLRGPAGLYQGAGEPGAAINLARKRAQAQAQVRGAASVGSWDAYRVELDGTSALNDSGSLRGRAVAVVDDRQSYKDVVDGRKQVLYGTLEYDFDPATTLSVGATRQEIDSVIDQGLPAYANGRLLDVSRSTFIGGDWNTLDTDFTDAFAEVEHRLDAGGQLKVAARHIERDMMYRGARANSAVNAAGITNLQTGQYSPDREDWTFDAYADLPFDAFGRRHNVIVGADWRKQEEDAKTSSFANTSTMNVFDPNHDVRHPSLPFNGRTVTETEQYGTYSQLRLKVLDDVTAIAGGRLTWWKSDTANKVSGVASDYDQTREFTPFAALVYDVTREIALYTSYSDIFKPQSETNSAGEQLKPRTGKQYEVGMKGEFANGLLNTQLAAFRIEDENRAIPDTNSAVPNASMAAGKVRSQGWEFEVGGQLAPGWDASFGYTRVDTEYLKGTAAQEAQAFSPATPRHSANLWTHYTFGQGALQGFSIGGGARAVSSFYATSGSVRIEADSYTVVAAQVGYQFNERWSANLTADNLLDEKYYEKVSGPTRQSFYGAPRSLMLAVKASLL